jgi:hypothetical protein
MRDGRTAMTEAPITATVSGSFRRAMAAVQDAVYALTDAGAQVLSPADPRVVDQFGDFLFVASDRVRAIDLVQDRHLAAIQASDFVWLVAPEGYIGLSGAMEIGHAVAAGTPVYCSEVPTDLTLRQYVTVIGSMKNALGKARRLRCDGHRPSGLQNVLLDPAAAIADAHTELQVLEHELTRSREPVSIAAQASATRLRDTIMRPLRLR